MTQDTARKLKSELGSLQGLTVINMMISALGFGFGAYFLMPTLIEMATTLTVTVEQVGMAVLGAVVFAVAFRWLFSIIKILEVNEELSDKLSKHKKEQTLSDDALTGLIIDFTATYRENKPTLKLMVMISKVACVAFVLLASWQLISLALTGNTGMTSWQFFSLPFTGNAGMEPWLTILSAAVCYGVAAASYLLPHFFGKYSEVWEQRLSRTAKAEAELQNLLGDAP